MLTDKVMTSSHDYQMLAKGSKGAFLQYLHLKYDVTRRVVSYVYALCLP